MEWMDKNTEGFERRCLYRTNHASKRWDAVVTFACISQANGQPQIKQRSFVGH